MRLHLPHAKGKVPVLQKVKDFIAATPGVTQAEFNSVTGSMLVHYDHGSQPDFHNVLRMRAETEELFSLVLPEVAVTKKVIEVVERDADLLAQRSLAARLLVQFFKKLDLAIRRATGNVVDLRVLLLIGVGGYSIVRSIRGKAVGPLGLILVLFAFEYFARLRRPELVAGCGTGALTGFPDTVSGR